jgi:arginine/lysine/histidine transporter system substrate-binding protein
MKRRGLLVALAGLTSLTIAIYGCNASPSSDTAAPETLTAVTSADYPPFEFYMTTEGEKEPVGFDIDFANYIAEELGYELQVNDMDFNGIIPALQGNRADFAIAGMTVTEERKQNIDFSDPYFEIENVLVVRQGAGITGFADLSGQKVGAQLGSTQEKLAQTAAETAPALTVDSRNRINEIIQEIKAGNLAAGVIAASVAKGFLKTNPDLEIVTLPDQEVLSVAIAFPKGSELVPEFNRVIAEMRQNGKLDELSQKWFEDYYADQ